MVRTVYNMGVHVIHSDADVVWFKDPLPYFISRGLNGPAHILVGVDALSTNNAHGEVHVEFNSNPFTNINTGVEGAGKRVRVCGGRCIYDEHTMHRGTGRSGRGYILMEWKACGRTPLRHSCLS